MAKSVVSKGGSDVEKWGPWHEVVLDVWECECGWWQIDSYSYIEQEDRFKDWWHKRISGELKSFNIADKNIPVNVLRNYLKKHNDDIYDINDRKMEELVASIFRDYYECDVEIVGKSGDGGVDLILINGDTPSIIQVKRRKTSDFTEPVKEIRGLSYINIEIWLM